MMSDTTLFPWIAPDSIARDRKEPLYLQMFAGTPDTADPSRFAIPYEIGGYRDSLDGYLRDDGTVLLRPRSYHHRLNPH